MAVIVLAFQAILSFSASAQSATNFDTQKITPKTAPQNAPAANADKSATPSASEPDPASVGPSRYVGAADFEAYVQSIASRFSMKTRTTDPFGQLQDPDAKPIVKPTIAKTTRRAAPTQITPFAEIIRRIQVTTIMPGERRFLIGTRSFKQGDRFPMNFRGRSINVEISMVNSREIEFRSLDNGEKASLKLTLLPPGMTPGSEGISAPGMVPDRPNAPLDIESSPSPIETSQH